jgi:hypothetical protein
VVHDEFLVKHLEDLASKLGLAVRRESVNTGETTGKGGLCRIGRKQVLFIDPGVTTEEKIMVMKEALRRFDLSDIYVLPAVRELLDEEEEDIHNNK